MGSGATLGAIGTAEDYGISPRVRRRPLRFIAEDRTLWDRASRRARTYGIGCGPVAIVGREDEDRGVELRVVRIVTPKASFLARAGL